MVTKPGRTSKEEIELRQTVSVIPLEHTERISPPLILNEREAEEWVEIVNSMPADWFARGNVSLLTQYVRHTIASQNLAQLIADATSNPKEISVKEYTTLLRAQKEESMVLSSLATKLRLTNQSLINKRGNHSETKPKKPWE